MTIPDRPGVKGHDLMALERFMDDTRHMIEFDVLTWQAPVGDKGDYIRAFVTEAAYAKALTAQKRGHIKIRRHAAVIEGHILPDKPKKRRRGR